MRLTIEQRSERSALPHDVQGLPRGKTHRPALPQGMRSPGLLVVDDSAETRDLLAELLEWHGFDVCIASSLEVALVAARRFRPAAVLLDLRGLLGEAMVAGHMLRTRGGLQHAFIAAVTSFASASDHETARAAGFDALLTKPLLLEELLAQLRAAGITVPQAQTTDSERRRRP
jgi:two-component system, cell cycle response regulator DivK